MGLGKSELRGGRGRFVVLLLGVRTRRSQMGRLVLLAVGLLVRRSHGLTLRRVRRYVYRRLVWHFGLVHRIGSWVWLVVSFEACGGCGQMWE